MPLAHHLKQRGICMEAENLGNGKAEITAVIEMCDQIAKRLDLQMKRKEDEACAFLHKLETW